MSAKRSITRRSDEQRIADLEARIASLQQKVVSQQRADIAVVRAAPKLQTRLREFAQLAAHNGRPDVANSTVAFIAGLERMVSSPLEVQRRARREREPDENNGAAL